MPEKKNSSNIGSVTKALNLVDLVMAGPKEGLTLSEIAREMKSSKSATHATLRTLVDHNYLRMSEPGPRYLPGMALIRLGDLASARDPIASLSRSIMNELSKKTGLTVRIARNYDGYPVFIERIDGPGVVRFFTPLGIRELPHVSSAGKAILAELSDERIREIVEESGLEARTPKSITTLPKLMADIRKIRVRGYAVDDEEDAQGVVCIGAAFYDHFGQCAGGISATGLKSELPTEEIAKLGIKILKHAEAITKKLGGKVKVRG
ncbi:MAG: IclR family transcriptional regulator [Streptomycetaceae bacterium]|nr:MAG: IclR family transcriptional regulator [Streptomycetaceae bacterium]